MAYDPTTDIGKVRRRIVDTVEPFVFTDAEVQAALTDYDGSVGYAAATLLESRAASLLLSGGRVKILDIDVDVTQAAKALKELAAQLRADEDSDGGISFSQPANTVWAQSEARYKAFLRGLV